MRIIKEALDKNKNPLGTNALQQLSHEIEAKENRLLKKEKENKITNIISIVGVVLTIFFGLFSLLQNIR